MLGGDSLVEGSLEEHILAEGSPAAEDIQAEQDIPEELGGNPEDQNTVYTCSTCFRDHLTCLQLTLLRKVVTPFELSWPKDIICIQACITIDMLDTYHAVGSGKFILQTSTHNMYCVMQKGLDRHCTLTQIAVLHDECVWHVALTCVG